MKLCPYSAVKYLTIILVSNAHPVNTALLTDMRLIDMSRLAFLRYVELKSVKF